MSTEQHIFEGESSPSLPPLYVGAHWIDRTTGEVFISSGIASVLDWGEPVNKRRAPKVKIRTTPAPAPDHVGVVLEELLTNDEMVRMNTFTHDHVVLIKQQAITPFEVGRFVVVRHVFGAPDGLRIAVNPGDEDKIKFNLYLPHDYSVSPGTKHSIYVSPGGAVTMLYVGLDAFGKETWDIDGDYLVEGVDDIV